MNEETIAMIFAGFAVVATLVSWAFYYIAGKSLWDMRKLFRGTPGDRGRDQQHRQDPQDSRLPERRD